MGKSEALKRDRTLKGWSYGRHLFELFFEAPMVTEIKACAVGAQFLFPEVRTILDIGGQDSKAIAIGEKGRVTKFEMNDRCAAGIGKFLEIMAQTLGYSLDQLGEEALKAQKEILVPEEPQMVGALGAALISSGH